MIYDIKLDGRRKGCLVAGGNLTDPNTESVYSGVLSLRGIRLIVFIAELNGLQLWGADVGNAYLEAKTKEKVYIVAGPEFGELEGQILIIYKSTCGLSSSGARWHEVLSDKLRRMGFTPTKADSDLWIRDKGDPYKYIASYVDDLLKWTRDENSILEDIQKEIDLKNV